MQLLNNKNILIGVTGSIAIYKTLELIRIFTKSGANVRIVMSENAKKFVSTLTFETISKNRVLHEGSEDWGSSSVNNHIAIGKWADIFIMAPATANTINKLACGIADNLLTQIALAYTKTIILAYAANTNMLENPITVKSIKKLKDHGFKMVHSTTKELACGDFGDGAMADDVDIFHSTCKELLKNSYWENRNVVLNGGGTIEKIDDVRFISNFSSGKMASFLATALYYKGANVTLVASRYKNIPNEISIMNAQNSNDMFSNVSKNLEIAKKKNNTGQKPYFFAVAAISDYTPKNYQTGKIKKNDMGDTWNCEFEKNIDILSSVNKKDIHTIGFKAELDKKNAFNNARNMIESKKIDGVCLNIIDENNNFGSEDNSIEFISSRKSDNIKWENKNKLELSFLLLDELEKQFE